MTDAIPSIDDVMRRTAIGGGFHEWRTVGGAIRLTSAELRPILEDAYDRAFSMPDWVALADFEDEPEDESDDIPEPSLPKLSTRPKPRPPGGRLIPPF